MSAAILLVVDQPTVAEFLAANLRHAGFVTITTPSCNGLHELLQRVTPDLIVVDAEASDSALIAIAALRRQAGRPTPPTLVLGKPRQPHLFAAEQILPTPINARTLLTRVNARLQPYQTMLDEELIVLGGLQLDPARHEVRHHGRTIAMGAKEFGLLHFMMQNPERVHRREQLLSQVWGDDLLTGERTVDVTVRRLRATLEPHGLGEYIETVRGAGYRFIADRPHSAPSPGPTHH